MLKIIFSYNKIYFNITQIICRNLSSKPSFQYRVLDYFEESLKTEKLLHQNNLSKMCDENICKSDIQQNLNSIYEDIHKLSNFKDEVISKENIDNLDLKCFKIIFLLKPFEILKLLNTFYKIAPDTVSSMYFYEKSISFLMKAAHSNLLSNHEIVQLIFYISLKKNNRINYMNYLESYLPDVSKLSLIEKCILAEAFYCLPIRLLLDNSMYIKMLEEDYKQLLSEPSLLLPICKIIIATKSNKDLTLKNFSKAILELKEPLDFTVMAHILRLYAKMQILEIEVINKLVEDSIKVIKEDLMQPQCTLDLRDMDTFLDGISYLGIILTTSEKKILSSFIEYRLNEYKTEKNVDILVNSILCINMLRCWNTKVLKICLQENIFQHILYGKFNWKVKCKLQLLIFQITMEMKMYVPNDLKKQIQIGYTPSNNLLFVKEICKELVSKNIIKKAVLECPIKTLIIPGITLFTDKMTYHIDVIDKHFSLQNTNIPNGLMNFKLRLLSRLRYRQIKIDGNIFEQHPLKAKTEIEQQIVNNVTYGKAWIYHKEKNSAS